MLILDAESGIAGANIKTPSDALWWGYVTITTVGYGDRYPVTLPGRIIGIFLLTAGVALFSVFTGFIANAFLTPRRRPLATPARRPAGRIRSPSWMRSAVSWSSRTTARASCKARLDDLERALVARRRRRRRASTAVERGPDAGAMTQRISAGILLFRRAVRRARGAPRTPWRPVLCRSRPRVLVDPEGRGGPRRGSLRRGPSRVRRGDRARPARPAGGHPDPPRIDRPEGRQDRPRLGAGGRPGPGRRRQQHLLDALAARSSERSRRSPRSTASPGSAPDEARRRVKAAQAPFVDRLEEALRAR